MSDLIACPGCGRHMKLTEARCPFCGGPAPASPSAAGSSKEPITVYGLPPLVRPQKADERPPMPAPVYGGPPLGTKRGCLGALVLALLFWR